MKNFNSYFENSVRSDLLGYNMSTVTVDYENPDRVWLDNTLGMAGIFCCGHQTDERDVLTVRITEGDIVHTFAQKYHRWTPAWCETIYRSNPVEEYYKKSGCIAIREKKCITKKNVFVSELVIINNKKEDIDLKIDFISAFNNTSDGIYKVNTLIKAGALAEKFELDGWFCLFGVRKSNTLHIKAGSTVEIKYCFAFEVDLKKAKENAQKEYDKKYSFSENESTINQWFYDNVPVLKTDNTELEKIYYYRYLLIFINTFSPKTVIPNHYIQKKAIYENRYGSWYGAPVLLPLPMHISEAKWLKNHELAKMQIEVWKTKKLFQGYIEYTPYSAYDYYIHHKDIEWLADIYDSLKERTLLKYSENRLLPVMKGSWFTGAEYQPSFYQWTEPKWDWRCDEEGRRTGNFLENELYRLDEISFFAANLKACSAIAKELGKIDDEKSFNDILEKVITEIKEKFWNEEDEIFYDVDVKTNKQCDKAACYDSFAPFLFGLINDKKYFKALDKIFDFDWFYDDFSITSTAKNCPMYWYDNCLVYGAELDLLNPHNYINCWNGPIWPFAVTLVLNALGSIAKTQDSYKEKWCNLFKKYTELHFLNGNRSVPCILEHYRPGDGVTFSRSVDYFHSAWIDLFMKYWIGIDVDDDKIVFSPFTDEEFELSNVLINGEFYKFKQYRNFGEMKRVCNKI